MKLKIMENALDTCNNRFQLTMMAVARAKEINEGESTIVQADEQTKAVVLALKEIAEGKIILGTQDEMGKIREAKRTLRDLALRIAEEEGQLSEEDEGGSYASARPIGETVES